MATDKFRINQNRQECQRCDFCHISGRCDPAEISQIGGSRVIQSAHQSPTALTNFVRQNWDRLSTVYVFRQSVVVNRMLNSHQAAHRFGIEALAASWPDFLVKASTPSDQYQPDHNSFSDTGNEKAIDS